MAWVAFDRAVKAVEQFGLDGPVDALAGAPRRDPRRGLPRGVRRRRGTRSCSRTGRSELDASLLMIPLVGFLPADDPRVVGHGRGDRAGPGARRVRRPLRAGVGRRRPAAGRGGVPALHLLAGRQPARCRAGATRRARIFERLLALRNDVGLLAEEYDPRAGRLLGQLPAGVLAHRADQHRVQPRHARGGSGRASAEVGSPERQSLRRRRGES